MKKQKEQIKTKPAIKPYKEISPLVIEGLAAIGCTDSDIAAELNISTDTIGRRKKDNANGFNDAYERGKGKGRVSLRRLQWQKAKEGNITMLIWLGKQYLDQSDKQSIDASNIGKKSIYDGLSLEELKAIVKKKRKKLEQ